MMEKELFGYMMLFIVCYIIRILNFKSLNLKYQQ